MPSGKTHIMVATGVTFALTCEFGLPYSYIVAGVIGGLWPDTDCRRSMLGRFIPIWWFCEHRAFTHGYMSLLLFSAFVFIMTENTGISVCFAIGYFTHIVLDWMTPMGVMWKWPNQRRYSMRRWK